MSFNCLLMEFINPGLIQWRCKEGLRLKWFLVSKLGLHSEFGSILRLQACAVPTMYIRFLSLPLDLIVGAVNLMSFLFKPVIYRSFDTRSPKSFPLVYEDRNNQTIKILILLCKWPEEVVHASFDVTRWTAPLGTFVYWAWLNLVCNPPPPGKWLWWCMVIMMDGIIIWFIDPPSSHKESAAWQQWCNSIHCMLSQCKYLMMLS